MDVKELDKHQHEMVREDLPALNIENLTHVLLKA